MGLTGAIGRAVPWRFYPLPLPSLECCWYRWYNHIHRQWSPCPPPCPFRHHGTVADIHTVIGSSFGYCRRLITAVRDGVWRQQECIAVNDSASMFAKTEMLGNRALGTCAFCGHYDPWYAFGIELIKQGRNACKKKAF